MTEWRDIPGFEAYYAASVDGQILSHARTVERGGGILQRRRARILDGARAPGGYRRMTLYVPGQPRGMWFAHELVMLAFAGPKPDGQEVRHLNGDPQDNRLANLAYGTRQENADDKVRHGKPYRITSTHCPNGHPYTEENTRFCTNPKNGRTSRRCLVCLRANWARVRARRKIATHD